MKYPVHKDPLKMHQDRVSDTIKRGFISYLFLFGPRVFLNQDELTVSLLLLEAKKERPGCMDRAYEEREMHHTLFGQNQPADMRDRGFQTPGYSLAALLRACESREETPHTHAGHTRALRVSEGAQHYEILFRVIF